MGQYKKRYLEARKIENKWKTKTRLYIEIAKMLNKRKYKLEEIVLKLREKGFDVSENDILQYIEKLDHTIYLKIVYISIIKYLTVNKETKRKLEKLLNYADKNNLLKEILETISKLSYNNKPDMIPTYIVDLLNKIENPSKYTDLTWWIKAWKKAATLKERYLPAKIIGDLDYVETSITNAKALKITEKTLVKILTPWRNKTIYGTASFSSGVFRISVKRQILYLADFLNLEKQKIIEKARRAPFFIGVQEQEQIGFFTSIATRGIFALPNEIYRKIGKQKLVFIKITSKDQLQKTYARTINFSTSKTRKPEPYLQIRELPKGIYYVTLYTHRSFLSQIPEQTTNLYRQNIKINKHTPLENIEKTGRYQYNIGKAILSINNETYLPVNIQVDTKNNQINYTQIADDNKTILNIIQPLTENKPNKLEIKAYGKNYPVTAIREISVQIKNISTSNMYLILGEMKRNDRIYRKNILISEYGLIAKDQKIYEHVLNAKIPEINKDTRLFFDIKLVSYPIRVHELNIENHISIKLDDKVSTSLYYWNILKKYGNIGDIGETIAEKMMNEIVDFIINRYELSKDKIFFEYQGKIRDRDLYRSDFEVYCKEHNNIVGFVEVSIGQNIEKTLSKHLLKQLEERFTKERYSKVLIGVIIAIEYSPNNNLGKIVILAKEKNQKIIDITKYVYNKMTKKRNKDE